MISISTKSFAQAHGVLMVVKGDVQILQKDKPAIKAKVGLKVQQGDTISTGKDARAKLVMIDKNIINISPDSKFLLEKYEYNPDQNKKGALLNVIYGKVRTTVNQKYDGEINKFQVKTKSSVAGVRGTDFLVSYNQVTNTSKVVTFEGLVEVGKGLDAAGRISNPVSVSPGNFTVAAIGAQPTTPIAMPETEMADLQQQTVAEAPTKKEKSDQGPVGPSDKKERTPSNTPPPTEGAVAPTADTSLAPTTGSGSVLGDMGEDVSAPVVGTVGSLPPPPAPIATMPTKDPASYLPPPTTIDPINTSGKTNVLINLQPY